MTTTFVPWQVHPGLARERLQTVAELIREARHQAVKRHEPSMGDDSWVLGCRAFKWSCFAIAQAANRYSEWLHITEGGELLGEDGDERAILLGHRFVFSIGGVPFRFYRGSADEVPSRSLRRHYPEIHAHQLAFSFVEEPAADSVYRLAVETDELGEASQIVLLEVAASSDSGSLGEPLRRYTIPELARPATLTDFPKREGGKELGEPRVGAKKPEKRDEGDRE